MWSECCHALDHFRQWRVAPDVDEYLRPCALQLRVCVSVLMVSLCSPIRALSALAMKPRTPIRVRLSSGAAFSSSSSSPSASDAEDLFAPALG